MLEEAVHGSAPGPEVIRARGSAPLRKTGDGTLERMAVQIGESRHDECFALITGYRLDIFADPLDQPSVDLHPHAPTPTAGQQGALKKIVLTHALTGLKNSFPNMPSHISIYLSGNSMDFT